ncbi:hypothetical protein L278_07030 [Mannheimia haemolytica D35]|nr:hypothetical protein L278_07030 [Mannheimia haemolytica D35]
MPNFSFTHLYKKHTKELPTVTLLSALIGLSQVSYANPLPLGNTTGTNNLAVGEGSFALGTGSQESARMPLQPVVISPPRNSRRS